MKANRRLLLSTLLSIYGSSAITLNNTFAQVRNLTNFYIEAEELYYFKLDEFFRGNFLDYSLSAQVLDSDPPKYLYDPRMFKITPPVVEIAREDFEQTENQLSLPQTSIIYTQPESNNKFFIFIDFSMRLYIYDVGQRQSNLSGDPVGITLISRTNLYNPFYINATARTCTNLLELNKRTLLMNCLGEGWQHRVVAVQIDISNILKPTAQYLRTSYDFQTVRDGKLVLLQRFRGQNEGNYMLIVKENKTTCYFDIIRFDGQNDPQIVRRVSFFNQPPISDEQSALYDINMTADIDSCRPRYPSNLTVDELRVDIDQLQIVDIEIVHFHENITAASDLNFGILFMELHCPNLTYCFYRPLSIVKEPRLGEISVMNQEGLITEQTLFVQKVNPPWVLEIQHEKRNSPSIRRIYSVKGDEGQYVSFSLIDANQDYILVHLISTKQLKPVFRIYKRTDSFLSVGHAEFTYTDFADPGVFLQFTSVADNFVLLKTSDYFSIIRIWSQNLIVTPKNYTELERQGLVGKTIRLTLFVSNMWHEEIMTQVDMMIMPRGSGKRLMRKYKSTLRDDPVYFYYNCGEPSLRISIDDLFEGAKDIPLNMTDLNEGELNGLFDASPAIMKPVTNGEITIKDCDIKTVIDNRQSPRHPKLLLCIMKGGDTIQINDFLQRSSTVIQNLTIKSGTFIDRFYETTKKELILLSNTTSIGTPGAVVHTLKFYNMLAWEHSFDLNVQYKDALQGQEFRFNQKQSQAFNRIINQGIMVGMERDNGVMRSTQMLLYKLNEETKSSDIKVFAMHTIQIDSKADCVINRIYLDRFANIWVVLSNHTLNLYQIVPHPPPYMLENEPNRFESLYLKKQFYFYFEPFYRWKPFISIGLFIDTETQAIGDKHVYFFGNDTMGLYRYVRGSQDIKRLMMLSTYYDQDDDIEANIRYEFARNQEDVVYTKYKDYLMLILMQRYQGKASAGYSLFVYDLRRTKSGTLLLKYHLNPDIVVNQDLAKVDIISDADAADIQVYLFADEDTLIEYTLRYQNQIEISSTDRHLLTKHCSASDVELQYELSSLQDPSQKAHIVIKALNTGLAITRKLDQDSISLSSQSISKISSKSKVKAFDALSSYSLGRLFKGHNQTFSLNCPQYQSGDGACENIALIRKKSVTLSKDIEFLSSVNTLLAFFVVDPAMVFIHRRQVYVYFPTSDWYVNYDLSVHSTISSEVNIPNKYFIKPYTDLENKQINFMLFQTEGYNFSMTLWTSSKLYPGVEKFLRKNEAFVNCKGEIFFTLPTQFLMVPWSILATEVFVFNSKQPLNIQNEPIKTRVVLAAYDRDILFNSLVKFYDLVQTPPDMVPRYKQNTGKIFSCNRLNLDSFTINAIKLVGENKPLLALGVQNYGIILFNIIELKIVKLISLQETYSNSAASRNFAGSIFINQIVSQEGLFLLYAIVNSNAVFVIKPTEPLYNYDSVIVENVYLENSIPPSQSHESAQNAQGFVFIQPNNAVNTLEAAQSPESSLSFVKRNPSLKFFSFYGDENSKGVGEMNLDVNEDCKYLQTVPYSMVVQKGFINTQSNLASNNTLIEQINQDQMITAAICGNTSIKIRAFDLYSDLLLNSSFAKLMSYDSELQRQPILVTSTNAYEFNSTFTLYLSTGDYLRNESGQTNIKMVLLFFVFLPLIFIALVKVLNRKAKESEEKRRQTVLRKDSEFSATDSNTTRPLSNSVIADDSHGGPKRNMSIFTGQSSNMTKPTGGFAQILEKELTTQVAEVTSKYEVSNMYLSVQSQVTLVSNNTQVGGEGQYKMLSSQISESDSFASRLNQMNMTTRINEQVQFIQ